MLHGFIHSSSKQPSLLGQSRSCVQSGWGGGGTKILEIDSFHNLFHINSSQKLIMIGSDFCNLIFLLGVQAIPYGLPV